MFPIDELLFYFNPVHSAHLLRWSLSHSHLSSRDLSSSPFPNPNNLTSAGNTYKNVYEATTMSSGLYFIILANIVTAALGVLFYKYVILRQTGMLTTEELRLLRKYPSLRPSHSYTPSETPVRGAPPLRWTGWSDFFTAPEQFLSRDAQVYLLFQRACILVTAVCAFVSSFILLPVYWFGGAVFDAPANSHPHTLLSLLKSDRGIFERLTSHNLPQHSNLVILQIPVLLVVALCVIALYAVLTTAAGEPHSIEEWLHQSHPGASATLLHPSPDPLQPSPEPLQAPSAPRHWTVFARGLPRDIQSADHLYELLDSIYPAQVARVELVCKGKVSEARLLRVLSSARHRLDYLYQTEEPGDSAQVSSSTNCLRIFSIFGHRRTRVEMILDLETRIDALERDFESRKAEPVHDFLGCAFISFRSPRAAGSVIRDFPVRIHHRPTQLRRPEPPLLPITNDSRPESIGMEVPESPVESMINRHARAESEWSVPGLRNLYRGTVNLLPEPLREKIISQQSSRTSPGDSNSLDEHIPTMIDAQPGVARCDFAITKLRNMKAERAPKSGDIIWRNIGISFFERTVREMVVQVVVFAFLILFTSPVTMLTALRFVFSELALLRDPQVIFGNSSVVANNSTVAPSSMSESLGFTFLTNMTQDGGAAVEGMSKDLMGLLPSFMSSNSVLTAAFLSYIPVLLLALVFAIVPSILRMTCGWEGYPTRSAQEMSVFRKTSFYYVMNAVVLPSLALNTASEFIQIVYNQSNGGINVYNALPILQRLISGDIAYFLCSYLVQLALTGSVFWLMRMPSSVSMIIRRRMALTPLEIAEAKCADSFDYPRHYAYSVTVMSMVLLFGFMAPLIWYFALFYFVCKHAVDVYTLRYVHPRTHIDGRLPRLSANFILTWTIVSQLSLAVIFYLQDLPHLGVITAVICLVTLGGCVSASTAMGNQVLSSIARVRDKAVQWALRLMGSRYKWCPTRGLYTSSSTSSSSQSLTDSHESDALLIRDGDRRISMEIDSLRHLRTSSVESRAIVEKLTIREDVSGIGASNVHEFNTLDKERLRHELNYSDVDADSTSWVPNGVHDELFASESYQLEHAEEGRANPIPQYGTCDYREGKPP